EIGIMLFGVFGIWVAKMGHTNLGIGIMLGAVFLLGTHSTFFGPIKYAILPQHLKDDEVLGGTGLVEAGTYLSILLGTVIAGWVTVETAGFLTITIAAIGWFTGRIVPPAPRAGP